MNSKKVLTFMLSLVAALGFSLAAYAQTGNNVDSQAADLEIEKRFEGHYKAVSDIEQKLISKEAELGVLIRGEVKDEALVIKLSKEIGELEGQLYSERTKFKTGMREFNKDKFGANYHGGNKGCSDNRAKNNYHRGGDYKGHGYKQHGGGYRNGSGYQN